MSGSGHLRWQQLLLQALEKGEIWLRLLGRTMPMTRTQRASKPEQRQQQQPKEDEAAVEGAGR